MEEFNRTKGMIGSALTVVVSAIVVSSALTKGFSKLLKFTSDSAPAILKLPMTPLESSGSGFEAESRL